MNIPRFRESLSLDEVRIPDNRLRELRDFSGIAESMGSVGLLQPITVTESGTLVAGRHRVEAARSLGWKSIAAFVVEEDVLKNRLAEIDENLRRHDLTVYEQSKHAEERERVLDAMGRRAKAEHGAERRDVSPATVAGDRKTTSDIASESGMSERSWQNRTKIGRSLGDKTRAVLDHADLTEEKHRNFLNSTTQLNHLANISNTRGDEVAAEVAEQVLTEEGGNTFKVYERMKESGTNVHFSSESSSWYTPPHVIERVKRSLGVIDLDPCAEPEKSVPAARHYTEQDDGLKNEWRGSVFMNPPYGKGEKGIVPWVTKLLKEYDSGRVTSAVALVPARTDTAWFAMLRDYPRCFIRGRLKFSGYQNSASFPSCAFYLGDEPDAFLRAFSDLGDIFERVNS